jgi:hypothetical protein
MRWRRASAPVIERVLEIFHQLPPVSRQETIERQSRYRQGYRDQRRFVHTGILLLMRFDANAYGPEVAAILALDGNGERLIPLVQSGCSSAEARARLQAANAAALFPEARAPLAAMAGLYVYFGCWDEAHEVAQGISSAEGSYWHAIVHRQEPDAGNSSYWFRQVGTHPIFAELAEIAGVARWDPFEFIRQCERNAPGALELQRAEWQLLFDYCAAKEAGAASS